MRIFVLIIEFYKFHFYGELGSNRRFEFNGGNIMIYCIVMGICAMFMFGIGLVQIKSQKPVAFYSGEKPPMEENVRDIEKWNRKHGIMWIL